MGLSSWDYQPESSEPAADSHLVRAGVRVRLRGEPIGVSLRTPLGVVVRPDPDWEGYFIVRLDAPAIYHPAHGQDEDLPELVEADDNLEVLFVEA